MSEDIPNIYYIRAKLDYGSIVYGSACTTLLTSLEPVCREALRITTGTMRTTLVSSLHALCKEMTLQERREKLSIRYYLKLKSHITNPAFNSITDTRDDLLFNNRNIAKPLSLRIPTYMSKYNLPRFPVLPQFSFIVNNVRVPTSIINKVPINLDLTIYPKSSTTSEVYLQSFRQLLQTKYPEYKTLYTDGSRSLYGVGAACFSNPTIKSESLPGHATVFSAELRAVELASQIIKSKPAGKYLILSDSLSVLLSLKNHNSDHPTIIKLIHTIDQLRRSARLVELCWIPGHAGIMGNERADEAARHASRRSPSFTPIYYKDCYGEIAKRFKNYKTLEWSSNQSKLKEVFNNYDDIPTNLFLTRREQVLVNRLRSGYCQFSHRHRVEGGPPPECNFCHLEHMSVRHVLVHCASIQWARTLFLRRACTGGRNGSLTDILGPECHIQELIRFLSEINLLYDV